MRLEDNSIYIEDIEKIADQSFPWEKLENKTFLISGSTGMIGSFLIDVLMYRNKKYKMGCKIYALGRNEKKARERFSAFWNNEQFALWSRTLIEHLNMTHMAPLTIYSMLPAIHIRWHMQRIQSEQLLLTL